LETPEDNEYFTAERLDKLPGTLNNLVQKLCPEYVPESLQDPQVCYDRLKEVLFSNFNQTSWLTVPFGDALQGDINARAAAPFDPDPDGEPLPTLYWLVQ